MRKHPSSLSFVTQSQPKEPEVTALEAYRAANPKLKAVQDALVAELHKARANFREGLSPLLHQVISKAEAARQVGIIYSDFADTLSGKKLTRDFYEQARGLFTDAAGLVDSFELVEWHIRIARSNLEPITDIQTAIKWNQLMLLGSGDEEFQLLADPTIKERIPPKDELGQLQSWLEYPEVVAVWEKLKANPHYFKDGHLRPDLRATLAEELRPVFTVLDELKAELEFNKGTV